MGVHRPPRNITICLSALSLLLLLLVCYGNSFQASWQYDDYPNIIHNERVHMTRVNGEQVMSALNAGPPKQVIARPLAYLSFALNYRVGKLNVFGYHVVNFAIHWLAAFFLFLWIRGTLTLPVFQHRYDAKATLIAWLAAVFWACHPIQVTAVTYIVQRMTSMEGMSYVMAMYGYMVGRRALSRKGKWMGLAVCGAGVVGALLSKENAVLLPFALMLYEFFFFQKWEKASLAKMLLVALGLFVALAGLSLLYMDVGELMEPFPDRPFNRIERMMTQPRVLFLYLSLIALPMTSRMTILHDVSVSRSLFAPWTTLPAILVLVLCLAGLCYLAKRHRLFAFCGLFFFMNHAVESSFLNLELIYEHRNYVPSMLLFVPLAIAAIRSAEHFYYHAGIRGGIASAVGVVLISSMQTVWAYNEIFRNEYALWRHNVELYPNKSLGYANLGKVLWEVGCMEESYTHKRKAIEYDSYNNINQKGVTYYNLGVFAETIKEDLPQALDYYQQAFQLNKDLLDVRHRLIEVQMKMGDFQAASAAIEEALKTRPDDQFFKLLFALKELKVGRYANAIDAATNVIEIDASHGHKALALMVVAQGYRQLGKVDEAYDTWKRLLAMDPENMAASLALFEISVTCDRPDEVKAFAGRLLSIDKIDDLMTSSQVKIKNENLMPYIPNIDLIKRALASYR